MNPEVYNHGQYLVRKKILTLAGAQFHVYDPAGDLVFYSKLKAFKLKEDIRLFTDESMREELLVIKARRVLDISSTYDVTDATNGQNVGAYRRKGIKSMLRDEWVILDASEREIGLIQEDSMVLALVRRFLTNLVPQNFRGEINGRQVCSFKQNFNPFVSKITLDFSMDTARNLDRRLGIAGAILLCAVEGRQA